VEYNFALVEVGINLVVLVNEFELFGFLILIFFRVSQGPLLNHLTMLSPHNNFQLSKIVL
jgi:hypothetical protein